jgi:hypothetical protein
MVVMPAPEQLTQGAQANSTAKRGLRGKCALDVCGVMAMQYDLRLLWTSLDPGVHHETIYQYISYIHSK